MLALLTSCGDDEGSKDYSNYSFDSVQIQLPDTASSGINIPLSCQADQDCFTDKPFCELSLGTCVECLNLDACGENEDCLEGECVPSGSICVPDKFRCLGKVIQQCSADGLSFNQIEVCEFGCANAQCTVCQPAQTVCSGSVVDKCSLDGSGWVIEDDCPSKGQTCLNGKCVDLCSSDVKLNTNVGCEYWAVDLDNHMDAQDGPFAIIVSNLSVLDASVTITRKLSENGVEEAVDSKSVPAGGLEIFSLPPFQPAGAGISWNTYHITSTAPIIAYQFNPLENVDVFSNDASMLIPENSFGKEYIVHSSKELLGGISLPPGQNCDSYCGSLPGGTCNGDIFEPGCLVPYRGTVTVVGRIANTSVTIKSTAKTLAGPGLPAMTANMEQTVTLQPFQTLSIKTDQDGSDLTGTVITADRPIGVFGGHEAAVTSTECCADHLEQQLFPVSTWGKEYIAAKSYPRGIEKDYWRILASEDGTTLNFNPAVQGSTSLNRGEFIEIVTDKDFVITSNNPISVAQVLASSMEILLVPMGTPCSTANECHPGHSCELSLGSFSTVCLPPTCSNPGSNIGCPAGHSCACYDAFECRCSPTGDPALILTPPAEQFRTEYVFLTPNKYANDYVNIVAPIEAEITLDNILVPEGSFTPVTGSGYKVARMGVLDGVHNISSTAPIGVVVYGYDKDVSYGYVAGLNLQEL